MEDTLGSPNESTSGPRAIESIVAGGIAVALLDAANAVLFWYFYRGTEPHVIFQSIAAGLYGRASFSGGMTTAWIGALLHCVIAFGVATTYYLGCLATPLLYRRAVLCGMTYGAIVYLVMNRIVIPLSNATPAPFRPAWFAANFGGHLLLVGLPVALIARWSATRKR
jgi:hypothetical protein